MIHMAKELNLPQSPLGINAVVKCIANLFNCNLPFRLRICCTTVNNEIKTTLLNWVKLMCSITLSQKCNHPKKFEFKAKNGITSFRAVYLHIKNQN